MPQPFQPLFACLLAPLSWASWLGAQALACSPPERADYSKPVACECLPATKAAWALEFPADPKNGVLSTKVLYKPQPAYPDAAKSARVSGHVIVQVVVDESGRAVEAHALRGPRLLWRAAVEAACQARFKQTYLEGQPVKVSGVLRYDFKRPGRKRGR
jgi:TonB family protein